MILELFFGAVIGFRETGEFVQEGDEGLVGGEGGLEPVVVADGDGDGFAGAEEGSDGGGLTARTLADGLDVSPGRVCGVLAGTRNVSADTAQRLGRHFGLDTAFWMNLQRTYLLDLARER